jgi:hypothetical protein
VKSRLNEQGNSVGGTANVAVSTSHHGLLLDTTSATKVVVARVSFPTVCSDVGIVKKTILTAIRAGRVASLTTSTPR